MEADRYVLGGGYMGEGHESARAFRPAVLPRAGVIVQAEHLETREWLELDVADPVEIDRLGHR